MCLIESIEIGGSRFLIYDGVDFDTMRRSDGTEFLIFLVEDWESEVSRWRRENRIKSLIDGEFDGFDPECISYKHISIYQTNGDLDSVLSAVKKKIDKYSIWRI